MKIATFNVNGVNGRLPVLLKWLALAEPDVVVLQELKAPQEAFPRAAIEKAGYQAIWHGQSRWNGVALLSRIGEIQETRRGLPGDPEDLQSRYIEAAVGGILIAGLYLPNGNPMPGPKFDYKLAWMARLAAHLKTLIDLKAPVVVAGDFNVIPTERDVYKPERWKDDALFSPEARAAFESLLAQGWTDAIRHLHPYEPIYNYWDYWRNAFARNAGIRIDHLLLNPPAKKLLQTAEVDTRPRGWEKSSDHTPVCIELKGPPVRKNKKAFLHEFPRRRGPALDRRERRARHKKKRRRSLDWRRFLMAVLIRRKLRQTSCGDLRRALCRRRSRTRSASWPRQPAQGRRSCPGRHRMRNCPRQAARCLRTRSN